MPPFKKKEKLLRAAILQKKKEAEKARLARIESDPVTLAQYKEKQRLKKKEKGQRKSIQEMTPREKRVTRKKWKEYSSKYRQKQSLNMATENYIRQNTPSTTDDEERRVAPEDNRPIVNYNSRAKEAKRRSDKQRKERNKQIKKIAAEISRLRTKLNSQHQKYKRAKRKLKHAIKSAEKTPKTRIEQMSEDVTKKKKIVKEALFGEALKIQLEENYAKTKSRRKKSLKVITGKKVDKYKLWRIKNKAETKSKSKTKQKKC